MTAKPSASGFIVWGDDKTAQGPVDLPVIVSWVKAGRVMAGTWVFATQTATWERAAHVPELQMFFQVHLSGLAAHSDPHVALHGLNAGALRCIKLLSYLSDEQLERFAGFVEVVRVPQHAVVVKQGDSGNAMYLIVEGELTVRLRVEGLETTLATLETGDFFGDFALFDHGPRSASVVAKSSCALLKISVDTFERLSREATDLATPFLRAIAKTLTTRIRMANKHHGEAVKYSQVIP